MVEISNENVVNFDVTFHNAPALGWNDGHNRNLF